VCGSLGDSILLLVLCVVILDDVIQRASFAGLSLFLEKRVNEAVGIFVLFSLLARAAWGVEGGLAAVVALLVEDDLLVSFQ